MKVNNATKRALFVTKTKSPSQCWLLEMPEKDILGSGQEGFNAP